MHSFVSFFFFFLKRMTLRSTHGVLCPGDSWFLSLRNVLCVNAPVLVYPFCCGRAFGLWPAAGSPKQHCRGRLLCPCFGRCENPCLPNVYPGVSGSHRGKCLRSLGADSQSSKVVAPAHTGPRSMLSPTLHMSPYAIPAILMGVWCSPSRF